MHILLGTKNEMTRRVCQEVAAGLSMRLCIAETLEDFLLNLQEHTFLTAIIDLALGHVEPIKVVQLIHRTRPKIPLIALIQKMDKNTGGQLYTVGVNYLCHSPPSFEMIYSAVTATLNSCQRIKHY